MFIAKFLPHLISFYIFFRQNISVFFLRQYYNYQSRFARARPVFYQARRPSSSLLVGFFQLLVGLLTFWVEENSSKIILLLIIAFFLLLSQKFFLGQMLTNLSLKPGKRKFFILFHCRK